MTETPEKLGKYKIVAVLGEGSMGVVYKAIDPDIQEYVALKTIHKKLLQGKDRTVILQRFINEVKAGRLLRHPNIVAMYEYQEDEDICFLVMEYVEGTTLKELIQDKQSLDSKEIVNIMNQLLDGLQAAHKQGVVHRDVKPENIILKDNGDVRIADFGVARLDSSTMTTDGSILGSPSYMSPEQCMGKQVDARSDLFSAGVVLYQMLSGEKPFSGMAFMETMQQILHAQPAIPSSINPSIAPEWDNIVQKALAKHAEDRFQSAADFQQAVKSIEANQSTTSRAAVRWLKWLLSASLLVTLIAGGFWFKTRGSKTEEMNQPSASITTDTQQQVEAESAISFDQQIKKILNEYACDKLRYSKDDQGKVIVSGYISSDQEQTFKESLNSLVQTGNQQLDLQLTPLVDSNCKVLSFLQPLAQRNKLEKHGLQIQAYQHGSVFIEGERPVFEIITPDFAGFLYVDYFMADGKVFHLLSTASKAQQKFQSRKQVLIGNYGETRQWQIVEPYGTEIMSVIVSDRSLFSESRADIEDSESYLPDLQRVLADNEEAGMVADSFIIKTISQTEAGKRTDL